MYVTVGPAVSCALIPHKLNPDGTFWCHRRNKTGAWITWVCPQYIAAMYKKHLHDNNNANESTFWSASFSKWGVDNLWPSKYCWIATPIIPVYFLCRLEGNNLATPTLSTWWKMLCIHSFYIYLEDMIHFIAGWNILFLWTLKLYCYEDIWLGKEIKSINTPEATPQSMSVCQSKLVFLFPEPEHQDICKATKILVISSVISRESLSVFFSGAYMTTVSF